MLIDLLHKLFSKQCARKGCHLERVGQVYRLVLPTGLACTP